MAEALARALRDCDLHVVGCYVRFAALLKNVRRCRPDIVIVDAAMAAPAFGAPDYPAQLAGAGVASSCSPTSWTGRSPAR
jgi:hypothetical protein